jgi:diacylglycerol O-acyltransferase / wax synthase
MHAWCLTRHAASYRGGNHQGGYIVKQLTGIDASFLNLESSTCFGHVSSLTVFERQDVPGAGDFDTFKKTVVNRLHLLPPFRRRLVEVPLGLDLPYWIEDPDFDIDYHVRHHAVPQPGQPEQLSEVVARIVSRPLDRTRPLWELYVIEGLEGDQVAMLTKIHHATIDGAAGAQMLGVLLDPTPDFVAPEATSEWKPDVVPSDNDMIRLTMQELLRRPEKMVRLSVRAWRELAASSRNGGIGIMADIVAQPIPGPVGDLLRRRLRDSRGEDHDVSSPLPPTPAPKTPWNAAITAHRRFAYCTVPLAEAKEVRQAFGCTFNDVVMAVCSGALRRYLERHDALPEEPLIAMVPVSVRSGDEQDTYSNRVSSLMANLATNVTDPVERLLVIRQSMDLAKHNLAAIPAATLTDFTQFAPPAIAARAMRMYFRSQRGDNANPTFNLIISNVPGPAKPLYTAGMKLAHFYPVSTVVDGQGLNMTVQSYNGNLDFGFIACWELVPDLWDLCDDVRAAMDELLAAARETVRRAELANSDLTNSAVAKPRRTSRKPRADVATRPVRSRPKAG